MKVEKESRKMHKLSPGAGIHSSEKDKRRRKIEYDKKDRNGFIQIVFAHTNSHWEEHRAIKVGTVKV